MAPSPCGLAAQRRVGDVLTTNVEKHTTQRNKDNICLTGGGKVGPEARCCWKTWSSGIPLSVYVSPRKLLPWQRAANREWEEEEAKKRWWWGLEKNRRNKKLPTLVSEQFVWTVCQVARGIPPGHYRFRRRANSEMESVPVISAQTHSAWWAQMRVSKATHVWNDGVKYKN